MGRVIWVNSSGMKTRMSCIISCTSCLEKYTLNICGYFFLSPQDGLIQQCGETMKETINAKTVCGYYNSAGTYGLDSVKKK